MKKTVQSIICIMLVSSMLLFCGCNEKICLETYKSIKNKKIVGDTTISNNNYTLEWNEKRKTVILKDNLTGNIWSPIPEDVLNNNKIETGINDHPQTESPIIVRYYDNESYVESKAISATSAIKNGRVNATKNKNGFSVAYDFKSENITVTVDYILANDGMKIEIDPNKVTENPDRTVTAIDVAPFFCSVKNGSDNDYLFVPSGSGALIYPDNNIQNSSNIEMPVYGDDLSIYNPYDFTNEKSVRLPVYGSVNADKGIVAIIEEGASSSSICVVSNDQRIKYSSVYTSFAVRGYETVDIPKGVKLQTSTGKVYSEPLTDRKLSIKFVPLQGEKASYYGMAEVYRSYLDSKYNLKEKTADQAVVLRLLGGVMTTEFVFGIPNDVIFPLTTIEQAQKIISDSNKKYKGNIRFVLDGYGSSGLEIGELAGGFKVDKAFGSKSNFKKLVDYCKINNLELAMNFDLLRFNKSTSGFSTSNSTAVAATGKRVVNKYTLLNTKMQTDNYGSSYLLSRNKISDAIEKLARFLEDVDVKNIMLDTLSNTLYSDYTHIKYYGKGSEQDVYNSIKDLIEDGYHYIASDANEYTVACAEYIDNSPIYSSNYDCFSTDIPFYQIVFKGFVPMYTPKWAGSSNEQELFLKAVESGIGISMAVVENYSDVVFSSPQKQMFACSVKNFNSHMNRLSTESFFDYYDSVKNAEIEGHILIEKDVRKTTFNNGVVVYVNYSKNEYATEDVVVPAEGYIVVGR